MTAAAVIVAAGSGQRFGDAGKSFAPVLGHPMAWWSLKAAIEAQSIEEIVLVCAEHSATAAAALAAEFKGSKPVQAVLGGARRQDSALAGIGASSDRIDVFAIHDAARPLVDAALFDATVAAAIESGAAIAAVPVTDTIKQVRDGTVVATVPREDLVNVQTPQAFQKALLLYAFEFASQTGASVTDEAGLVEAIGAPIRVVPGYAHNLKVTFREDLDVVKALLKARTE